jgi:hypothetical protein
MSLFYKPSAAGVPDSEDLLARYDWREASGTSSVADQSGNGNDLSGTYTGPSASINGNQAGRFDGTDDILDTAFNTRSQPNHIFLVARWTDVSGSDFPRLFDNDNSNKEHSFGLDEGNTEWFLRSQGSTGSDGSADTNAHIFETLFDGSNSTFVVDGTQRSLGSIGTDGLDGFQLGARADDTLFAEFDIGEVLIYPQDKSTSASEIRNYLSDEWGISV